MNINWDSMSGPVITVISDLHANKLALSAALEMVHNQRSDQLIILGDILTYGMDTQEVVDLVQSEINNGAWLIMGNHDQIYNELISGHCAAFTKLHPWLQETINFNFNKLNAKQFSEWNWQQQIIYQDVLFSHANPYGNVWSYINTVQELEHAAKTLKNINMLAGVFGHTHRSICWSLKNQKLEEINGLGDDTFILNPGSVGQPRAKPTQSSLLRLSSYNGKLWSEIEDVKYDVKQHIESIISSSLSDSTKEKLISFFNNEE